MIDKLKPEVYIKDNKRNEPLTQTEEVYSREEKREG